MHIPDGLLDATTSAAAFGVSGAAVGYAIHRVHLDLPDRAAPLMGMTAACLFAAQTLNVPLLIAPTSGHLLGGVLAAVALGPWGGILVITAVLLVQCVLFQDGGLTALGANVLLLGVIGSGVGYALYATVRRVIAGPAGVVAGGAIAAWFSVQLSAIAAAVMIAVGPTFTLGQILGVMMLAHALIGLGEAAITGLALSFVMRTRPDLIFSRSDSHGWLGGLGHVTLAGGTFAVVLAVIAAPLASQLPDGLQSSLLDAGFDPALATHTMWAPFAEYEFRGLEQLAVAGSVAGVLGVVAVFGLAYGLARAARVNASPSAHSPDAG